MSIKTILVAASGGTASDGAVELGHEPRVAGCDLGDPAAERPLGLVADDHDGIVGVFDDVAEVVALRGRTAPTQVARPLNLAAPEKVSGELSG